LLGGSAFMLRVYVLLPVFIVLTQALGSLTELLPIACCSETQPRSCVYIKCKTDCMAAQRFNLILGFTTREKPHALLFSK